MAIMGKNGERQRQLEKTTSRCVVSGEIPITGVSVLNRGSPASVYLNNRHTPRHRRRKTELVLLYLLLTGFFFYLLPAAGGAFTFSSSFLHFSSSFFHNQPIGMASGELPASSVPLDSHAECIPVYRAESGHALNLSEANYTYTVEPDGKASVHASLRIMNPTDASVNATILFPVLEMPSELKVYLDSSPLEPVGVQRGFNKTFLSSAGKRVILLGVNVSFLSGQVREVALEYTRGFVVYDDPDEWGKLYYRLTLEVSTLSYADSDGFSGFDNTTFSATFLVNEEIFTSRVSTSSPIEVGGKIYVGDTPHHVLIISKKRYDAKSTCDLVFMKQRSLGNMLKNLFLYSKYRYYIWAFLIICIVWYAAVSIYKRARRNERQRKLQYLSEMERDRYRNDSRYPGFSQGGFSQGGSKTRFRR